MKGKIPTKKDLPYDAPKRNWDKQWEAHVFNKAEEPGPHPDP